MLIKFHLWCGRKNFCVATNHWAFRALFAFEPRARGAILASKPHAYILKYWNSPLSECVSSLTAPLAVCASGFQC